MPDDQPRITAKLAAAVQLDEKGRLVSMPLIGKDITREFFHGGAIGAYRGAQAGHGPRYERWFHQRTFGIILPQMTLSSTSSHAESTKSSQAMRYELSFASLQTTLKSTASVSTESDTKIGLRFSRTGSLAWIAISRPTLFGLLLLPYLQWQVG